MIYRNRLEIPDVLENSPLRAWSQDAIDKLIAENAEHVNDPDIIKRHDKIDGFIQQLEEHFDHKCAYCETPISLGQGMILFYRPREYVQDWPIGVVPDGPRKYYYWLAWHWPNMYLACPECAIAKGYVFPITAKHRAKPGTYDPWLLLEEGPLLLDPCQDNPHHHLEFQLNGLVRPRHRSRRGQVTIEVFNLNRPALCIARKDGINLVKKLLDDLYLPNGNSVEDTLRALLYACGRDQPYAAVKQQIVITWVTRQKDERDDTFKRRRRPKQAPESPFWQEFVASVEEWTITPPLPPQPEPKGDVPPISQQQAKDTEPEVGDQVKSKLNMPDAPSRHAPMNRPTKRDQVFISYSHQDEKWLKRLQAHLAPLERAGVVKRWDDTSIEPGSRWKDEIKLAIATTKVAVLLISAEFLASEFIDKNELPSLLVAAESEGAVILPVIVGPSLFEHNEILSRFQAVNPPSQPLSTLPKGKQDAFLVKVAEAIKDALHR